MAVWRSLPGFTLLEILLVLLLISVIAGLSVHFLGGKKPVRLEPAAWELSTAVKRTLVLARMDRVDRVLVIDLDNKTYGIQGFGRKKLPDGVSLKILHPRHGEVAQGEYRIVFPGSGGIYPGAILVGDGRRSLMVRLDPVEGAVLVRAHGDEP